MPARTVVISGGGTGMGKAVAASFARSGDDVIIMGRRADVLRDAVRDLESQTSRPVRWRACDVSDPAQLDRLVDWLATEGIATVDVLVNNAGGPASGLPEKTLADVAALWEADFRGNVLTAVLPTSALLSRLRRPGGRIVTVSSIAALRAGGSSYGAAKGALIPWTYSLATELGADGITVNIVAPGYVEDTEFFGERMTQERRDRLIGQTLVGRAGRPEDVAGAIHYLASPEASFITGQILQINGGALFGR